jgi:hypothetical protein
MKNPKYNLDELKSNLKSAYKELEKSSSVSFIKSKIIKSFFLK